MSCTRGTRDEAVSALSFSAGHGSSHGPVSMQGRDGGTISVTFPSKREIMKHGLQPQKIFVPHRPSSPTYCSPRISSSTAY